MMDKYVNTYWYRYNSYRSFIIHITSILKIENEYKVEYKYIYSNIHNDNPAFSCRSDYIIISLNEDFDDILKTEDYKPATKELFDSVHNKYKEYRKMFNAISKEVKKEYKKFFTE